MVSYISNFGAGHMASGRSLELIGQPGQPNKRALSLGETLKTKSQKLRWGVTTEDTGCQPAAFMRVQASVHGISQVYMQRWIIRLATVMGKHGDLHNKGFMFPM